LSPLPKTVTFDPVISDIARYVAADQTFGDAAYAVARNCLLDAIACALDALDHHDCTNLMGPYISDTVVPKGVRVPGTSFEMDPVKAAFDMGTAIRWLDYNDAWFAADGAHPSDNLGAIMAAADLMSRRPATGVTRPTVRDVLTALIKAYEIQGVLALENSFDALGLDATTLVDVASAATATRLLGGTEAQIANAVSNAWLDGASPRTFRLGSGTGSRKSWASGDATSRGMFHALLAVRGEMGYPAALTIARNGFNDAIMRGKAVVAPQAYGSYIVENVLFKVPFPTQFHAQTATECCVKLHPLVKDRISDIRAIHIRTHARTISTIDKRGVLRNAADRDHCLQYILAMVLIHGRIASEDYEDAAARDPRIDPMREKMFVTEDKSFTADFYDAKLRSNCNAVRIEFADGTSTEEVRVDYPVGHPTRRDEGLPLVDAKFRSAVHRRFKAERQQKLFEAVADAAAFDAMHFDRFMDLLVK
jgi:2-methylcitrate dehydratase